jgi:hypothetical protein
MKKTTTYDVGLVLAWNSHKNMAGLNQLMGSQPMSWNLIQPVLTPPNQKGQGWDFT